MLSWPGYSRQGICQASALPSVASAAPAARTVLLIAPTPPIIRARPLAEKFDLGLAEKDEIYRRHRDRPVDAEDRDLELVARLDCLGEDDAIGHVEALDGGRAGVAGAARHLAIDPHLRIIVDVGREYRLGAGGIE